MGTVYQKPFDIAKQYFERGWMPLPVPYKTKKPTMNDWQKFSVDRPEFLSRFFNGRNTNVGVLLGKPSGGLTDVDCDSVESVRIARMILPQTKSMFGRSGRGGPSHFLYRCDPAVKTAKFEDDDGMIVEMRSTGTQTIFPGSVHPSGERIEWVTNEQPAPIDGQILFAMVSKLAAAALLAKRWVGHRHNLAIALAGALRHSYWEIEDTSAFVEAIAEGAGDDEVEDRVRAVADTYEKTEYSGWPKLAEILDDRVIKLFRKWLGIKDAKRRNQEQRPGVPVVTCAADVIVEKINWIWRGRLARKKAVLWVGAPGDGKGTVAADIAARMSTGSPMPDGEPGVQGDVLFIASEDGISDIWVPRLKAAGADLKRIHHVAMIRRIDEDGKPHDYLLTVDNVSAIESVLVTLNEPVALFVDPIGNHIGDRTDTDKDNKIRAALVPLCALAEKYNIALILIGHRRKASGRSADETMMGSTGFVGLCRAIFHFGRDKQNRDLRYFLPGKTNIGIDASNLSFHIEDYEGVGRVVWDKSPALMTADELLTQDSKPGPQPECREIAEDFLRQLLADGPVPAKDAQEQAKAAGITLRTVRRAADSLKVRREKCAFTKGWQWRLPKAGNQLGQVRPEDGQQKPCVGNMANMDTFEISHQEGHIKPALAREGVHVGQDSCTDEDIDRLEDEAFAAAEREAIQETDRGES